MIRSFLARARNHASLAGCAASLLLVALVLLAMFVARRAIAEHMALDWLRRRGVTAAVSVRALDLTRIEAHIALGPSAGPTLTADSVEMGYRITGPWEGRGLGLEPSRLLFTAPRLAARYDGRRLTFGALQPIVDDLLAHPSASGAPRPSIAIRRGRLDLATPYGPVTLFGDATVSGGRLDRLDGVLGPVGLAGPRFRIEAASGARLSVTREGGVVTLGLTGPFTGARIDGANMEDGSVALWARAPYPDPAGLHGPAQVVANLKAARGSDGGLRGAGASALAALNGALAVDDKGQSFAGTLRLGWRADRLATSTVRARQASADVRLASVRYDRRDGRATWQARISADAGARTLGVQDMTATGVTLTANGQASEAVARLIGRLSSRGSVTPEASRRLVAACGLDRWARAYADALGRALKDFTLTGPSWRATLDHQGWRVALPAPVLVSAQSGARLTVAGHGEAALAGGASTGPTGGFDAALNGGGLPDARLQVSGWSAAAGRIDADLAIQARLDLDLAADARVDGRAHATLGLGQMGFALAGCAPVSAASAGSGEGRLTQITMRVCSDGGPLAAVDRRGWRISGRIEGGAAESPATAARIADVGAVLRVYGETRRPVVGSLRLTGARLSDITSAPRFALVAATGQASMDGDALKGEFVLATPKGHAIGDVTFAHDLRGGNGRAHLATHALTFATNGPQPSDLTPMLRMIKRAHGHVDFAGDLAWSSRGLTSTGVLSTRDLGFTSPVGDVVDASGDIALTSLAPLATAPNQTITARRLDGVVPISDVTVGFEASATALDIRSADAVLANGDAFIDPFHVDLAPEVTWRSTLNLRHVDVGRLVAASSLASSMTLQAVVDGRLPFEAGPAGVRFTRGRIESLSPGRLTIARAALAGAGPAASGGLAANNAARDFAYQALEDLAFDSLDASIDSVPVDRLRVLFHIKGRHEPPVKTRATVSLWALLRGKAFDKPMPLPSDTAINLTLDTSLNFGELIRSLDAIWNGGARERSPPVQGPGPPEVSR